MLVMDFCHSFKLGQDFNLKDLNRRLFMPFVKCLIHKDEIFCKEDVKIKKYDFSRILSSGKAPYFLPLPLKFSITICQIDDLSV